MINLAVATSDEKYLERLANRLHGNKDINLLINIITIKNLKSEVKRAIAFLKQMIKQRPDILLLDQDILRDAAALDLGRTLDYLDKLIATKIIVVGKHYNEEIVMVMIHGGVRGFFRTALGDEQLIKCIRVVAQGEFWLDAELITRVFEKVIKEFKKQRDLLKPLTHLNSAKLDILSPREMEVLALVNQSMTNEEIADKLFLTLQTVKTHMRNIFAKTKIRNRVEASLLYTRRTLILH